MVILIESANKIQVQVQPWICWHMIAISKTSLLLWDLTSHLFWKWKISPIVNQKSYNSKFV